MEYGIRIKIPVTYPNIGYIYPLANEVSYVFIPVGDHGHLAKVGEVMFRISPETAEALLKMLGSLGPIFTLEPKESK
ncbi:MAG: hypothetical protein SFZ02_12305 [bacterium]|nr:hypothetical protein [bacterium]